MKKYECTVCHWVYDPQVGDQDNGVEPGTPFEQIPDDWTCPLCGVSKEELQENFNCYIKRGTISLEPKVKNLQKSP